MRREDDVAVDQSHLPPLCLQPLSSVVAPSGAYVDVLDAETGPSFFGVAAFVAHLSLPWGVTSILRGFHRNDPTARIFAILINRCDCPTLDADNVRGTWLFMGFGPLVRSFHCLPTHCLTLICFVSCSVMYDVLRISAMCRLGLWTYAL